MTTLPVDNLTFVFDANFDAEPYDRWKHTASLQASKAMDVVAVERIILPPTVWLIEAKDYRVITQPPKPANLAGLPQTVAQKVQDTLAGLADAAHSATEPQERSHAVRCLAAKSRRVVLHLEPHAGPHSRLYPNPTANVLMKLKPLVRAVDPNPLVLSIATTPAAGVPWQVS